MSKYFFSTTFGLKFGTKFEMNYDQIDDLVVVHFIKEGLMKLVIPFIRPLVVTAPKIMRIIGSIFIFAILCSSQGHAAAPIPSASTLEQMFMQLAAADFRHNRDSTPYDNFVDLGEPVVPVLLARFAQSTDDLLRANIALVLGNIGGDAAKSTLIKALSDKNGAVRQNAAFILLNGSFDQTVIDETSLLNAILETVLHQEFLVVLQGIKPFSVQNLPVAQAKRFLDSARISGVLANKSVGWFISRRNTIQFYSRPALQRLLSNATIMHILRAKGFPDVQNVEDFIRSIEDFWNGKFRVSQKSFDTISGILMGFPLAEVVAYAEQRKSGASSTGWNLKYFPPSSHGDFFGWFVVSTRKSETHIAQFKSEASSAIRHYEQSVTKGMTALEIVNTWPKPEEKSCRQLFAN